VLRGLAERVDLTPGNQQRPRELILDAALAMLGRGDARSPPTRVGSDAVATSPGALLAEHRRRMGEEIGRLRKEARRLGEPHPNRWAYFEQARLPPGSRRRGEARRDALRAFIMDETLFQGLARWYRRQVDAVLEETPPPRRDHVELMVLAVDALWIFELIGLRSFTSRRRAALVDSAVRAMRS
jgi:Tetracyclin repressor-like, C-terminal domain